MAGVRGVLLVVLSCMALASGCAGEAATTDRTDAASQFDELVRQGDDALQTGDAKAAFDLYTQALALPEANDADGTVTAAQSHAKSLFIARNLLAHEANPLDPKDSVTILVEYSDAETETVEAKRRVIQFLQGEADSMRRDIPALKSTIEAEEEYKVPLSIYMADAMTDTWTKTLGRIPGDFGTQAMAALGLLARAADEANIVTERDRVEDCIADLEKSESTLNELDAALEAMRSQL